MSLKEWRDWWRRRPSARPKAGFASPAWRSTVDDPREPVRKGTFGYAKDEGANHWRPIVLGDDGVVYDARGAQIWADSGRGEVAEGERVTWRPTPATVHQTCTSPLLPTRSTR
jgi:endo-1,4-beta-mannosidase